MALAADLLGVAPRRAGRRALLTAKGLVAIDVVDRFTELAVDLHWSVVADALAGDGVEQLSEFHGCELEGHQLAFDVGQLPRITCTRKGVQ
jgi:hypothetical protein